MERYKVALKYPEADLWLLQVVEQHKRRRQVLARHGTAVPEHPGTQEHSVTLAQRHARTLAPRLRADPHTTPAPAGS